MPTEKEKESLKMARYTESVCRLCRREGAKLFLKGERCFSEKCSVNRRSYPPGQHSKKGQKKKDYEIQLREKQKAKRIYGVYERQFRKYFANAEQRKGITGDNLLIALERRLDTVVYALGFGLSRPHARQLITHGQISVNARNVDIPSYAVKEGDVVSVKEAARKNVFIGSALSAGRPVPSWLEVNKEKFEGRVLRLPARADISLPVSEHLIVEHYSR